MSQANITNIATGAATPATANAGVRSAIARAAQATGVDFNYLLAQAKLESSLNAQAHATASSAAGLYQFTTGTWGTMLARHGADLGGAAASAIPTSRAQLLAMRYDPNASAMMAAELAGENTTALTTVLGRPPTSSELYLAHFLGAGGATRLLSALATNPDQSAAALLPKAAAANAAVFFEPSGAPRSVAAVMSLIQARMAGALSEPGAPASAEFATTGDLGGIGAPPSTPLYPAQQLEAQAATDNPSSDNPAMSDTLRNIFDATGAGTAGTTPDFVRSAYGRLQALGL